MSLLVGTGCCCLVCIYILEVLPQYFTTKDYGVVVVSMGIASLVAGFQLCYVLSMPLQSVIDSFIALFVADNKLRHDIIHAYRQDRQSITGGKPIERAFVDLSLEASYRQWKLLAIDPLEPLHHTADVLAAWYEVKGNEKPPRPKLRVDATTQPSTFIKGSRPFMLEQDWWIRGQSTSASTLTRVDANVHEDSTAELARHDVEAYAAMLGHRPTDSPTSDYTASAAQGPSLGTSNARST